MDDNDPRTEILLRDLTFKAAMWDRWAAINDRIAAYSLLRLRW